MRKLFLALFFLVIPFTTASFTMASNPEKSVMKSITHELEFYLDCKTHEIHYDNTLDLTYAIVECPGLWKGDINYPVNNITDLFNNCANVITKGWSDEWQGMITGEFTYLLDEDISYTVMITYYKERNVFVIVLYENENIL